MPTKLSRILNISLLALSVSGSVAFAWTAPTAIPPTGNIDEPINTGSGTQGKSGGFAALWAVFEDLFVTGPVQFGTAATTTTMNIYGNAGITGTTTTANLNATKLFISGARKDLDWDAKEPALPTGGTTAHYLRGDKTWQTLPSSVAETDPTVSAWAKTGDATTIPSAKISGSYSGITGVGTVTAGTWNGTAIADSYISSAATWNAKAPTESPTFTGTVNGITSVMVGLGNVTNESKSTMFTSPTFTGSVTMPGSGVWNASGNIGIGILDPGIYKLNVAGNTNIMGNFDVTGDITGSATTKGTFWDLISGSLTTGTITTTGNVGIGTTDLGTYKLNVAGDVYIGGNNGNVITKTSTGGVTNDGLPNCAAGSYLKWDGTKWACAMSPSGSKHYFLSMSYTGNLGGISGANAKCNSDTSALPGRVYYAQLSTALNGWGVNGVGYFNSQWGTGIIGSNNYGSMTQYPSLWTSHESPSFPSFNCSNWSSASGNGHSASINPYIKMGSVNSLPTANVSCSGYLPILCAEY